MLENEVSEVTPNGFLPVLGTPERRQFEDMMALLQFVKNFPYWNDPDMNGTLYDRKYLRETYELLRKRVTGNFSKAELRQLASSLPPSIEMENPSTTYK